MKDLDFVIYKKNKKKEGICFLMKNNIIST